MVADTHDLMRAPVRAEVVVVSVDYRMGPSTAFRRRSTTLGALEWADANAASLAPTRPLGVHGDSAGANSAASHPRATGGPKLRL